MEIKKTREIQRRDRKRGTEVKSDIYRGREEE